jgi:hypothetical protein
MGNPYLDGEQARNEFIKLQKSLKKRGYSISSNDSRSQVLDINGKCRLIVMSSPSSTLFGSALAARIKKYADIPTYVVLTRDSNEYPDKSMNSYWSKINKVSTIKTKLYQGLVIGIDDVLTKVDTMVKGDKLEKPYKNQIDFSIKSQKSISIKELNAFFKKEKVSKKAREVIEVLYKLKQL